jgi:hypothetical protein
MFKTFPFSVDRDSVGDIATPHGLNCPDFGSWWGRVLPHPSIPALLSGRGLCIRLIIRPEQWFPTFFHLHTPWQPIFIKCTLHIIKMFVINIVVIISTLYAVIVNK